MKNLTLTISAFILLLQFCSCNNMSTTARSVAVDASSTLGIVKSTILQPWISTGGKNSSIEVLNTQKRRQTVAMDSGGIAVMAYISDDELHIQHFSKTLELVQMVKVHLDMDEERPQLLRKQNVFLLLTTKKLKDNRTQIGYRIINFDDSIVADFRPLIAIPEDFKLNSLSFYFSRDTSKFAVIASSKFFEIEDSTGKEQLNKGYRGAVLDVTALSSFEWSDSIPYPKYSDKVGFTATSVVLSEGSVMTVEILHEGANKNQIRVLSWQPDGAKIAVHDYPSVEVKKRKILQPSQIFAQVLSDGNVCAITRNLNGDNIHSIEQILIDRKSLDIKFKTLVDFNEPFVRSLNKRESEYSDDNFISDFLLSDNGDYVVVFQKIASKRDDEYSTQLLYYNGPITYLYFDSHDSLLFSSILDMKKKWSGALRLFEAGYTLFLTKQKLYFIYREHKYDGALIYEVDVTRPDIKPSAKLLASLGGRVFFAHYYSIWSDDNSLFLFFKEGLVGSNWQMMRVVL